MAGEVLIIKGCSPLKICSGLTGMKIVIQNYSYNLPLWPISKGEMISDNRKGTKFGKSQFLSMSLMGII